MKSQRKGRIRRPYPVRTIQRIQDEYERWRDVGGEPHDLYEELGRMIGKRAEYTVRICRTRIPRLDRHDIESALWYATCQALASYDPARMTLIDFLELVWKLRIGSVLRKSDSKKGRAWNQARSFDELLEPPTEDPWGQVEAELTVDWLVHCGRLSDNELRLADLMLKSPGQSQKAYATQLGLNHHTYVQRLLVGIRKKLNSA